MAFTLPLESASEGARRAVEVVSLLAVALVGARAGDCAKVMKETGGVGVLPLEMIGSWERADLPLAAWRAHPEGMAAARRSLRWDFLFIAAYAGFGLAVTAGTADWLASVYLEGWADAARWAGLGIVGAGLLDVVENIALLRVLAERRSFNWPRLATSASKLKWALAGASVLVGVTTIVARHGVNILRLTQ